MTPEQKVEAIRRRKAALHTPTDLGAEASQNISGALNALLADVFTVYIKTKNFHWHMSGRHFEPLHALLDRHADEILSMTDAIAERVRKLGGTTIRSVGHITRLQRIEDNDADFVSPEGILAELRQDNVQLIAEMRGTHSVCAEAGDVGTTGLIEAWIDQAEKRSWFLFETLRG